MFEDLRRDLTFAMRSLRRSPAFTVAAVVALGLAIAANATVFSLVAGLLTPFAVDDPDRLTIVWTQNQEQALTQFVWSADDFLDLREQVDGFERLAAGTNIVVNRSGDGEPRAERAWTVSGGFLEAFGPTIALGRGIERRDEATGADLVAVVSHSFYESQLGGERSALGRSLVLDGQTYTVVGVAAENFFFPDRETHLWLPLRLERGKEPRDARTYLVVGRLPDAAVKEATLARVEAFGERLANTWPATHKGWSVTLETMRENASGGATLVMGLLYSAITFVLLIACANVANLILSRATLRERELAMRTSLGASRGRLIRQLLTESLLLAMLGGALGLALARYGINVVRNLIAPDPAIGFLAAQLDLDPAVLLHTGGVVLVAALLLGLLPAIQLSRPDISGVLREGSRGSGGPRRRFMRGALITAEVALALALLGTAGGLIRSFQHLYSLDPGFDPESLLTLQVSLPEYDYETPAERARFVDQAVKGLAAMPAVERATASQFLPLTLGPGFRTTRAVRPGEVASDEESAPNAIHFSVGPHWLETFGAELTSGRLFDERDRADSEPVVVLNRVAAELLWPGETPLDRTVQLVGGGAPEAPRRVVGVIESVQMYRHSLRFAERDAPVVMLPVDQDPQRGVFLAVRTSARPDALTAEARQTIWKIDPRLPVDQVLPMTSVISRIDTQNTFIVGLLTCLAMIALSLAAVGIYGVVSYSVAQRSREIGIRMALGARPGEIVRSVVGQAAKLTVIGLVIGLGLAFAMIRLAGSQLEGLAVANAAGPMTFIAVSLILLFVAQLAGFLPARRAARLDPARTLRAD